MTFPGKLLINAVALWAAVKFVPGVSFTGPWWLLLVVALLFGALNSVIRPVLMLMTLPFFLVTLGLFTFVLNAFMLWMTGALADLLALGFHVDGFAAAFFGALVVSTVSFVLSVALTQRQQDRAVCH